MITIIDALYSICTTYIYNVTHCYSCHTAPLPPVQFKYRNSWQCQKCSLMRGGDTYLAPGRREMSGIHPASWGIFQCLHLTSHIRRVLRVFSYSQNISFLIRISLSASVNICSFNSEQPANISKIREDFSSCYNPAEL